MIYATIQCNEYFRQLRTPIHDNLSDITDNSDIGDLVGKSDKSLQRNPNLVSRTVCVRVFGNGAAVPRTHDLNTI